MKIQVLARPKARMAKVELIEQTPLNFTSGKQDIPVYKVSVKEPPIGGRANEAIVRALADYFGISQSSVLLVSGATSRKKIFEIVTM